MKQLEIEYFFPLTEQIPLDLDFSQCSPHQYWYRAQGIAGVHGPVPTGMVYKLADTSTSGLITVKGSQLDLDVETVEFKLKDKPNFVRRIIYKVMGVKWKVK